MTDSIKRYMTLLPGAGMIEREQGDWVRYSDLEALAAQQVPESCWVQAIKDWWGLDEDFKWVTAHEAMLWIERQAKELSQEKAK